MLGTPWRESWWWLLVAAPAVVVLALVGWIVAWPLLGRPTLPAGTSVVGVVAATAGPLGVVGLRGDARYLRRTGSPRPPTWPRYALVAAAVAVGIAIAWEVGDGSAVGTAGEAGAALTEAMAPVGLYYLLRRRRTIESTDRD